jgi:hypothetical protein
MHYFVPLKAANKEDRERLDEIRQQIIELHATMLQTAYDNEHIYTRWEYILTCMLGKDTGIPRNTKDTPAQGNKSLRM